MSYVQPIQSSAEFKATDLDVNENVRTLQGEKANYSEVGGPIDVVWQNGLFVPVTKLNGFDEAASDAKAGEVFLTLLKRFNTQNRNASDKPSRSYAPALFAKEPDCSPRLRWSSTSMGSS